MLKGYKTYILGTLGVIVTALAMFGVIEWGTASQLLALLGFGSAMALRSAISNGSGQ